MSRGARGQELLSPVQRRSRVKAASGRESEAFESEERGKRQRPGRKVKALSLRREIDSCFYITSAPLVFDRYYFASINFNESE